VGSDGEDGMGPCGTEAGPMDGTTTMASGPDGGGRAARSYTALGTRRMTRGWAVRGQMAQRSGDVGWQWRL
jgi:hypothetical protein